jgi:hypothetical protein
MPRESGWEPDLKPTQQRLVFHDPADYVLVEGEKGCRSLDAQVYTEDGPG